MSYSLQGFPQTDFDPKTGNANFFLSSKNQYYLSVGLFRIVFAMSL